MEKVLYLKLIQFIKHFNNDHTGTKKELGLSNKDIAEFFNMTYGAFANSSAKQRYETALCKFYSFLRKREKNNKITSNELD